MYSKQQNYVFDIIAFLFRVCGYSETGFSVSRAPDNSRIRASF